MLEKAQQRIGHDSRVRWQCENFEDARPREYDAIVCHFVLDGFEGEHLRRFVGSIFKSLKTNGVLLVSDFDSRVHLGAAALVVCMQCFFKVFAGVPMVEVTKPDDLLVAFEMTKVGENHWWNGTIFSQIWKM